MLSSCSCLCFGIFAVGIEFKLVLTALIFSLSSDSDEQQMSKDKKMDPVMFSLPEILLNDREEPDYTLSFPNFSPCYHQPFPPEELDIHELSLQTSHEFFTGPLCLPDPPLVMDEPASLRASKVASEMLWMIDQRTQRAQMDSNQQSVQHLIPIPVQPQIQAQGWRLQALSPGTRPQHVLSPLFPELTFCSCSPQDPGWMNMSPVASPSNSTFGFSPCVLVPVSSPVEFWFSPYSPPGPCLHPRWCLCPQAVRDHQPCNPDL